MKSLHLGMICFLFQFLFLAAESVTTTLNDDVLGLIVFKAGLLDPQSKLASWNEDDDEPCSWAGVHCDPKSNRVTELSLDGFSLSGKLGRGLLRLQFLETLSLAANNFTGSLSPDFLRLQSLRSLDLSANTLSGTIPDGFFGQCGSIRDISLAKNFISGKIPLDVRALQQRIENREQKARHLRRYGGNASFSAQDLGRYATTPLYLLSHTILQPQHIRLNWPKLGS